MQPTIADLVTTIHDTPGRVVLVAAGAGASALAQITAVAGASRTLLEGLVPYDEAAFEDFLGQSPEQFVAAGTARLLAGRALARARWLAPSEAVAGLACTATITTDRPKRGEHRAHVACWRPDRIVTHSLHMEKGARPRAGEERLVCRVLLNTLAMAWGLKEQLPLQLGDGDRFQTEEIDIATIVEQLSIDKRATAIVAADGTVLTADALPPLLLAGAFDPLHEGHLALARAAEAHTGRTLAFELSIVNVDKPSLEMEVVLQRLTQFAGRWPIAASRAPTFLQKSSLFPGATFVVGYDTALRVIHPRYYGGSEVKMRQALETFRERGCDFLIAGRADESGRFHPADDLQVPPAYEDLFNPLPGFREDISSTELRQQGRRGSY